jgi:uncharacterized protein YbjT (DUF2867 family)
VNRTANPAGTTAMNDRIVTVFGGTGFLGSRVVRHLRKRGFSVRIASRHPDRGHRLFALDDPQLQSVPANIHDERSVANALAGAFGVVNAVSLYVEHGQETFQSVHVEAAERVELKHTEPESSGSPTFQESAPTLPHLRSISASVAKANWRSGPRLPTPHSSAPR